MAEDSPEVWGCLVILACALGIALAVALQLLGVW